MYIQYILKRKHTGNHIFLEKKKTFTKILEESLNSQRAKASEQEVSNFVIFVLEN